MRGGGCYYDIALNWYCILFSGLILHPFFWLVKEPVHQICIYNFLPLIVTCILMICFQLLVWWPTSSEEAWPWSPMSSEKDRANMIVLSLHGSVVILSYGIYRYDLKEMKIKANDHYCQFCIVYLLQRISHTYLNVYVLSYRPNIDVLTFARTECDPIYAGFRYVDMGSNYLVLYRSIRYNRLLKGFSFITPLLYYHWLMGLCCLVLYSHTECSQWNRPWVGEGTQLLSAALMRLCKERYAALFCFMGIYHEDLRKPY